MFFTYGTLKAKLVLLPSVTIFDYSRLAYLVDILMMLFLNLVNLISYIY